MIKKCTYCNTGILEKVNSDEPWHSEHYQCANCDSTYMYIEENTYSNTIDRDFTNMKKSWSFRIEEFDHDKKCWKCNENIEAGTPSLTVDYETFGKILCLSTCKFCSKILIEYEKCSLEGLEKQI